MAVSAASVVTATTDTPATSITTSSMTASANRLVLAVVHNFHATAANEVTLTGGGLTWTKVRSDTHGTHRVTLFRAMSGAPGTATAVAATVGGQTATGWRVKIVQFDGVQTGGTNGSAALQAGSIVYRNVRSEDGTDEVSRSDGGPWDATAAFFGHDSTGATTAGSGFSLVGSSAGAPGSGWALDCEFSPNRVATAAASWPSAAWLTAYHISLNQLVTVAPSQPPAVGVPWWDGLRVFVEVGFAAGFGSAGVWDTAVWDESFWGSGDTWVDVSRYVRQITTRRRFARDVQAWETGEASVVLDNRDGRFSPTNLAGPYVTGGVTQVRPWRPLRIRFTYNGETFDVYTGYAVTWQERYSEANVDASVNVSCVDEQGRLSLFDGLEQAEQGSGETTGQRVHRILTNAGYTGIRNVDSGVVTCQPTTLASNAVTELKLTADSEGGALWVGADGSVWFADQYGLLEDARSVSSQATFTDYIDDLYPVAEITPDDSGDLLANIVAFARVDGTAQSFADASSRALYGDLRYTRTDLVSETDPQVAGVAEFYLQRYREPEYRFASLKVTPRTKPSTLFRKVLDLRVRDRVTVVHDHPGGHTVTRSNFLSGVSHTMSQGGQWDVVFELQSATPYDSFASSRWDAAVWDGAPWFY
jgi:hypothetical protein